MFGLESATAEALEGLGASVQELYEKTQNLNDKKIQLKCSEVQRRVEVRQHALIAIGIPRYIPTILRSFLFALSPRELQGAATIQGAASIQINTVP